MASQAQQEIARGDYGICWGFLENQSGQSWFGHSLSCFWVRDELDDSHSFQTYLLWFYRGNMKNRIICASRQTLCFWGFIYFTNPCHEILHQQHINALIHVYKALFSIKPVFKKKSISTLTNPKQPLKRPSQKDLHRKTFFAISNNSCKAPPRIKACSSNKKPVFSTKHRHNHQKVTGQFKS